MSNCLWRHFPTFQHLKHFFSSNTKKKKKGQNLSCLIVSKQNISEYLTDTILIFIGILARWYYGLSGHNHVPQRDFVILKYLLSSFYHLGRTEKRNTFKVVLCHCYMKKVFYTCNVYMIDLIPVKLDRSLHWILIGAAIGS